VLAAFLEGMTDANQPAPKGVEEFEAFVRGHQDMVYATAVRLLGNPAEAEDVAQTVFLKAFERFDTLAESPSAAGWLKTVTKNACLNHLTRYRSRWQSFGDLASAGSLDARLTSDASPARDLEHADERERLEAALRRLPDHQRVPLVLFHFEEASYEDIATALGISIAKVKTDIHRGREALRHLLVPDATRVGHGSR
jgi:RNA polymerase sigma-70 factor (ECF subfamily)